MRALLVWVGIAAAFVAGCHGSGGKQVDGGQDRPPAEAGAEGTPADSRADTSTDSAAPGDVGIDGAAAVDLGRDMAATIDVGVDLGIDVGRDMGIDVGVDMGVDTGADTTVPVDAGSDAGTTSACISGAAGTYAARFRWSNSASTATVVYEANTLPDPSRWHVSASNSQIDFSPAFVDQFLAMGGLDLEADVFIDVELSTAGLPAGTHATVAVLGRSYNTTTSGSFTWQTFSGTGATPTNFVSNVPPYRWYAADATTALPPAQANTLLRLRAGPSSNALVVNSVEICFGG